MYFDEKLKALRVKAGLTIEQAAEQLDVTEACLEAMETGFKDPDKIEMRKITEFYQITEEELADDEPYVNAFSVLFQNSDMSESNLGSSFALAAGLLGGQQAAGNPPANAAKNEQKTGVKQIPLVKAVRMQMDCPVYEYLDESIIIADLPAGDHLAFRVPDDSMLGIGIYKDDVAIIRLQETVAANEIAVLVKDNTPILRRFIKKADKVILEAANPLLAPEILCNEHFLLGRLLEVRKYF